jgi:hypothetical protein
LPKRTIGSGAQLKNDVSQKMTGTVATEGNRI